MTDKNTTQSTSMIDTIDAKILKTHEQLGNFYAKKTSQPPEALAKKMHGNAALAFGAYGVLSESYLFGSAMFLLEGSNYLFPRKAAEPSKFLKVLQIGLTGIGIASTTAGVVETLTGIVTGTPENVKEGVSNILFGFGAFQIIGADYMGRSFPTKE